MSETDHKPADPAKPTFMAFVSDAADQQTLRSFAMGQGLSQEDVHAGDVHTATDFLKKNKPPQVLVVELPNAEEAPGLLDKLADVCDPETRVIAVGSVNEYSFYCWLTDIGIASYLLKPVSPGGLEGAFKSATGAPKSAGAPERAPGKVISVIGTRGGVGATTMSINLAGVIADRAPGKQVILVDTDVYYGSVALCLDIDPSRGMREALENPDRLDALFIDRVVSKPLKNLSVLSSEEALHDDINVHERSLPVLLKELRSKFDVILFDLPCRLDSFTRGCLQQSDQVVVVTELSLLSLRDCLRLTDMMREHLHIKPPHVIANRSGLAAKIEMQVNDFEKGINAKLEGKVPFAPDVFMPISTDVPAVKKKTHAAVKPLAALSDVLLPELKAADGKAKKASFLKK